jgi:hypothetical protein
MTAATGCGDFSNLDVDLRSMIGDLELTSGPTLNAMRSDLTALEAPDSRTQVEHRTERPQKQFVRTEFRGFEHTPFPG